MKVINHSELTWRFLTWKGHPAGTNTACPKCCSNNHGSTPEEEECSLDFQTSIQKHPRKYSWFKLSTSQKRIWALHDGAAKHREKGPTSKNKARTNFILNENLMFSKVFNPQVSAFCKTLFCTIWTKLFSFFDKYNLNKTHSKWLDFPKLCPDISQESHIKYLSTLDEHEKQY